MCVEFQIFSLCMRGFLLVSFNLSKQLGGMATWMWLLGIIPRHVDMDVHGALLEIHGEPAQEKKQLNLTNYV